MKPTQFNNLTSVINRLGPGDRFQLPGAGTFTLLKRKIIGVAQRKIDVLTFECEGRLYGCNVWDDLDIVRVSLIK
jgi:hypothetical protein